MPRFQKNDEFLSQLSDMYNASRESGSVSLVFKKVSAKDLKVDEQAVKKRAPKEGTQRAVDSERLSECAPDSTACLVRAVLTGGKRADPKKSKRKISTLVLGAEQAEFNEHLVVLNKQQMDGLKRRQKKVKK